MNVLSVSELVKKYERFELKKVSFELTPNTINGFIGRNGAGKTTTLKSLLNFVHPDSGKILFWGKSFADSESEIKQKIGFVSGGVSYYPTKKLKAITNVTKRFYDKWDDNAYRKYIELFKLVEDKTPAELSEGMKVKYALALALSHNAELLILDEPTSGLDPVSRDELLDVFISLVDDAKVTILFSTHITTDLEKCADNIIYIKNGEIIDSESMNAFTEKYRYVKLAPEQLTDSLKPLLIGCKKEREGYSAIVSSAEKLPDGIEVSPAGLETIMIHMEKE